MNPFRKLFQSLMSWCGLRSTLLCPTPHWHLVSFVLSFLFFFSHFQSFPNPPFTSIVQNLLFCPPPYIFPQYFFTSQLPRSQCSNPRFAFSGEWKCVKTWFDRGALMHSFQSAAQKVLQGKGLQGMKSYMQRQPAPQSSQSRETAPRNSSPAEVLAGSLG